MRRLLKILSVWSLLGLPALPLLAQTPAEAPPGFEPVSGPAAGQAAVQAPPLVVAAYVFIWACTLAYVVVLWRRQRRLATELEGLEQRLRAVE